MCDLMAGFPSCTGQEALDYISGRKVPPWLQPDAGKADSSKEQPKAATPEPEQDMGPNPGIPGGIPRVVSDYVELPVAWMDATSQPGRGSAPATPEAAWGRPSPRPASARPGFPLPHQPMPPTPGERPAPVRTPESLWGGRGGLGHMDFRTMVDLKTPHKLISLFGQKQDEPIAYMANRGQAEAVRELGSGEFGRMRVPELLVGHNYMDDLAAIRGAHGLSQAEAMAVGDGIAKVGVVAAIGAALYYAWPILFAL